MTELPTVPVAVRVHLAHATVQAIADEAGVDLLHIKGPSVDPSLRPQGRSSVDADVLVRPSHLKRLLVALRHHGWQEVSPLEGGGFVQHSTNWYHGELGQMDVHVRFPGIRLRAEAAFDVLWRGRGTADIAHRPCTVPDVTAQRLILLLHAARDLPRYQNDIQSTWSDAPPHAREDVQSLARALDAEVALGAATGRLEEYRDRPEYALWRLFADGEVATTGFRRLRAELHAAPAGARCGRLRIVGYAFSIVWRMPRRLEVQFGRKPTRPEIVRAYATFFRRGLG